MTRLDYKEDENMNKNKCPDCEDETCLCKVHQTAEIAIDEMYDRGSNEWYHAMKEAGLDA